MSRSAMIPFAGGRHLEYVEFHNSHGLGARVWDSVVRHLEWNSIWGRSDDELREFWELAHDEDLPASERIVFASTFDRCWIPAEHIPRVAAAYREFLQWLPPWATSYDGKKHRVVCHLSAAADAMEAAAEAGVFGVAFWQTSVADNPWGSWDESTDEYTQLYPERGDGSAIDEILIGVFPPHGAEQDQSIDRSGEVE